jgi:2-polyprenyl-6-methoxyphenol hydroxylase-like FAD-dependent oxidoreductase
LAHWLHRRGAEVTVVEPAPGLRQALRRGVVREVIRRMGLDAAVREACTDSAGQYIVDTRDRVEYIGSNRIAELSHDADGVDVTFASGGSRRLVSGADRLHSPRRAMVFGPREQFVRHRGLVLALYTCSTSSG